MTIKELFGTLQQSIVEEWRKHLKTSKYSKHMALDEFYKEMPDLVDALIEDYIGHVGKKVEDYKNILDASKLDALQYLEELHKICQQGYDLLPEDAPELKSDLDAIKSKIDTTMYKVRELKESILSLKDFLKESLNEASRINLKNMDNKDLIKLYYDEWSGFNDGGFGGETPKTEKIYAWIEKKVGDDMKAYKMTNSLIDISEIAHKMHHADSYKKIKPEVRDEVHRLIDKYFDELWSTGEVKKLK